jgi:general secretion pathway protein I
LGDLHLPGAENPRTVNPRAPWLSHRGFTLVEVMVALAVVAVALPALMVALYQQIDGTAHLQSKSLAQMVAANKLTEVRILAEATRQLPQGRASGVEELAERQWYWWRESAETEVPSFYRIEITVAASEEQIDEPLVRLVAFMSSELALDSQTAVGAGL